MHIEEFNWGTKMTIFNFVLENTWGKGNHGWGCGYVAIPEKHIAFNKKYSILVKVHGGVTYDEIMKKADVEKMAGREFPDALDCEYRVIGFDTLYKSGDDRWLDNFKNEWTEMAVRWECSKFFELVKNREFTLFRYDDDYEVKIKACVKQCWKSEQGNHEGWLYCPICGGEII